LIKELEMFGLENELQEIFSASTQGKKYFGHAPPKPDEKTRKKIVSSDCKNGKNRVIRRSTLVTYPLGLRNP
jgi:hypothetical protein